MAVMTEALRYRYHYHCPRYPIVVAAIVVETDVGETGNCPTALRSDE